MNKKKKIWFAVINDLNNDQRMHRICLALHQADYEVTLVGRETKNSLSISNKDFHQKRLRCFFQRGPLMYLEFNIRLFFLFLRGTAEVHGACDLDTLLALTWAAKLRGRPTVFDAHEYFTEVPEVMHRRGVKSIWSWVGKSLIPHTKLRYTVNDSLAIQLENKYGVPFDVIRNVPNEVSDEIDSAERISFENATEDEKILIYQGALNVGRGLEASIEMMLYLPHNYTLWIVGDGDITEPLTRQASKLKLEDRVIFWGNKSPIELKQITRKATIGLNLLDGESLNYYHSLANKFFDYLHAEIPSVNMHFPAYEAILKNHEIGIMVDHLEPKYLAGEIDKLCCNQVKMGDIKKSMILAQGVYNWSVEQSHLLKLYAKNL